MAAPMRMHRRTCQLGRQPRAAPPRLPLPLAPRRRLPRCAAVAGVGGEPGWLASGAWMLDPSLLPDRYVGPLECVRFEGKGRGLRTTRPVTAGELLLLVPSIAAVVGPAGEPPSPEQLVDGMLGPSEAATAAVNSPWIGLLYDGKASSAQGVVDLHVPTSSGGGGSGEAAPTAAAAAAGEEEEAPAAAATAAAGGSKQRGLRSKKGASGLGQQQPAQGAKRQRQQLRRLVARVVAFNAFGDRHQDLALAAAARAAGHAEADASCVGLWGEFSLLNHSCAPNAINYPLHVAGGRPWMAVRAARDITEGAEVNISYVGADQLVPLGPRRAALKSSFGFECGCPRCAAEAAVPEPVAATVAAVAEATAEMRPAFDRALAVGDISALRDARLEASADLAQAYGEMRRHLVRPKTRLMLQAGLWSTLELVADADEAVCRETGDGSSSSSSHADQEAAAAAAAAAAADSAAASLGVCLSAIESVSPGSDLHTEMAARAVFAAKRRQAMGCCDADAVAAAALRCDLAHALRYGAGLEPGLMAALVADSERLALAPFSPLS